MTKTVNNSEFSLDKSIQEILYRINNWVNEGSGWIIETINGEYVNISMYSPLIGSSFVKLPNDLKNSKKGLSNIKNNDSKSFLWCRVIKNHPERIKKEDKKLANNLNYEGIEFPISKKDYCKIEKQNNICINVFCYENGVIYPLYISGEKFCGCTDLLLIFDESKSHYVYIKDFNRLMFNKTKNKNKKYFCRCCLQCFSSGNVLTEHKGNFLVNKM